MVIIVTYLHDTLDNYRKFGGFDHSQVEIPNYITDNLKWPLRPYQIEAFQRHIAVEENEFNERPEKPMHLVYNMATGSGKTYIMAGLILHMYRQGYRNFLFFVHTVNIVEKTKMNFLAKGKNKYLFTDTINIDGKEVFIKQIENFSDADEENINIKFMTIGGLHSVVKTEKENDLVLDDLANRKVVYIADEFHHYHRSTKTGSTEQIGDSWEGTIDTLLKQNDDNVLLGFTATLDDDSKALMEKLQELVVFKYDLASFRMDRYSKEIELCRTHYEKEDRIYLALILSTYRVLIAAEYGIGLKPVILFKSSGIAESKKNQKLFLKLVKSINGDKVRTFRKCGVPVIQQAFSFFDIDSSKYSEEKIAEMIIHSFREENTVCVNEQSEAEATQILVNTLENSDNLIRAVFAVNKLDEGWDVLNLFDIVRLYEGQNTGGSNKKGKQKIGKKTVSEAQLIGRGARYWPYDYEDLERDKRKFDSIGHHLKVIETLHYHTKEDSRYISELKGALRQIGMLDDDDKESRILELKPDFLETEFYKKGKILLNGKQEKSRGNTVPFDELTVSKQNHRHQLSTGVGKTTKVFDSEDTTDVEKLPGRDVKISDIDDVIPIVRHAMSSSEFFNFGCITTDDGATISSFYPDYQSIREFIQECILKLEITFAGHEDQLANLSRSDYLAAIRGMLQSIEHEIKAKEIRYENTTFVTHNVRDMFSTRKELHFKPDDEKRNGQESVVGKEESYVYNANYGTDEEKAFIELFYRRFDWRFKLKFKHVYLLRNELDFKIYLPNGDGFQPDYVIFCIDYDDMTTQIFVEPKGAHLIASQQDKADFLKKMRDDKISIENILLTAPDFFKSDSKNDFKEQFEALLGLPTKESVTEEELQKCLSARGLPHHGSKEELIERLNSGKLVEGHSTDQTPSIDDVEDTGSDFWSDLQENGELKQFLKDNPERMEEYMKWLEY